MLQLVQQDVSAAINFATNIFTLNILAAFLFLKMKMVLI